MIIIEVLDILVSTTSLLVDCLDQGDADILNMDTDVKGIVTVAMMRVIVISCLDM